MALDGIAKYMVETRLQMIAAVESARSEEFSNQFGLREGDILKVEKDDGSSRHCQIVAVDNAYWNQRGGMTARLTVAPLLVGGKIGKTRTLVLVINANGTGLRELSGGIVEPVTPHRSKRYI